MSGAATRFRQWWANLQPAGYLPGVLLSRLRHDMGTLECEPRSDGLVLFRAGDIEFLAQERVEPHFLMHEVSTQFIFHVPGSAPGDRHLQIRHRGSWKRTGIECIPPDARLEADASLTEALLPLDFTHCELAQDAQGWQCRLTHFGASEVVYRMPPLRRYVRLSAGQRDALLATFRALLRTPALR